MYSKLFSNTSHKGVSLITLVITIIVIIILAGAVILSLSNTNVIGNANNAVKAQNRANAIDMYNLAVMDGFLDPRVNGDNGLLTPEIINEKLNGTLPDGFRVGDSGNLQEKNEKDEWVDVESKEDVVVGTPAPEGGTVFSDKDGKKVPVPLGFTVDSTLNVVSEGLVITDTSDDTTTQGNQFVWVPVKDISTGFTRTAFRGETLSEVSGTGNHYEQYSKTEGEYKAVEDSVKKYGGFYVGRFEAGVATNMSQTAPTSDTTGAYANGSYKPVSKKGVPVWNYIRFSNAGITDMTGSGNGAVKAAHSTYNNKNGVYSTILYPQHWDTICNWMLETPVLKTASGIVINNTAAYKSSYTDYTSTTEVTNEILNNSSQWGNHYTSSKYKNVTPATCTGSLQNTGNSENYSVKNIYDLAGNVWEWNFEAYSSSIVSLRGGSYNYLGYSIPVSDRNGHTASTSYDYYGFRLALYIK